MSEYQYYEFQAVDRPLTDQETRELRSFSTRARITPTSFVNDYAWGSFKGDKDAWMAKYFDAFVYVANWGTRTFKLRLPLRALDPATAEDYDGEGGLTLRRTSTHLVLSFESQDEEGGDWEEGEGWLASLLPIRAELARGDLRALYLGWLQCAEAGEFDPEDLEPSLPPGLAQLSAAQASLVEFLRIDNDLLAVAAEASAPLHDQEVDPTRLRAFVAELDTKEKDDLLVDLLVHGDAGRLSALLRRFRNQHQATALPMSPARTVGELLEAAERHAVERRRVQAERKARERAEQERQAAVARQKHLERLVGQEARLWAEVEALVATKLPKNYDRAMELLVDLRDLSGRGGATDFRARVIALRQVHVRKPAFIARLDRLRI